MSKYKTSYYKLFSARIARQSAFADFRKARNPLNRFRLSKLTHKCRRQTKVFGSIFIKFCNVRNRWYFNLNDVEHTLPTLRWIQKTYRHFKWMTEMNNYDHLMAKKISSVHRAQCVTGQAIKILNFFKNRSVFYTRWSQWVHSYVTTKRPNWDMHRENKIYLIKGNIHLFSNRWKNDFKKSRASFRWVSSLPLIFLASLRRDNRNSEQRNRFIALFGDSCADEPI